MASKTVKQFIMVGSGEYSSKELSGTQLRHQQANNVHKDEALDCFWTFTEIISFMIPVPGMSCRWQYFVLQFPKCHLWGSALSAPFPPPPPWCVALDFWLCRLQKGPESSYGLNIAINPRYYTLGLTFMWWASHVITSRTRAILAFVWFLEEFLLAIKKKNCTDWFVCNTPIVNLKPNMNLVFNIQFIWTVWLFDNFVSKCYRLYRMNNNCIGLNNNSMTQNLVSA